MIGGSQRRSLLDGEISRRESTALDALDHFLSKLVDAFDFQIEEHAVDTADVPTNKPQRQSARRCSLPIVASTAGTIDQTAYTSSGIETPDAMLSPRGNSVDASVVDPTGVKPSTSASILMRKLNEKLTEFVMNESLDRAASDSPMELGWRKSTVSATTRSSWLDDFRDLRDRATLSSMKAYKDDGAFDSNADNDDLNFLTDDECPGHSYQIMA